MQSKLKTEDNEAFRSNLHGSVRNGARAEVGGNDGAPSSTASFKMHVGAFGINQVPTNLNPNLMDHANEVRPDQSMSELNGSGSGDESVASVMVSTNLMSDTNDTNTNANTPPRNASH